MRSVVAVVLDRMTPPTGFDPAVGVAVMGTIDSCAGEPT